MLQIMLRNMPYTRLVISLSTALAIPIACFQSAIAQTIRDGSRHFSDTSNHWAASCIQGMQSEGVMKGYLDKTFRPERTLTRAEFAAVVVQAFPDAPRLREAPNFVDVAADYWGREAIATAYEKGFLSGYPNNVFRPNQAIIRAQAMTVIANAQGLTSEPERVLDSDAVLEKYFSDAAAIPDYAKSAIAPATQLGLIVNYPTANQLRPNANITRAEATALLCRRDAQGTDARYYVPAQYVAGWQADRDGIALNTRNTIYQFPSGTTVAGLLHTTAILDDNLFFFLGGRDRDTWMWRSDGTTAGTAVVKALSESTIDQHPIVTAASDQQFWMKVKRFGRERLNEGLWRSDGTAEGTQSIFELDSELTAALETAEVIAVETQVLFKEQFPLAIASQNEMQLWLTDGATATETQRLLTSNIAYPNISLDSFTPAGDYLFFSSFTNAAGAQLWRSDGTPGGTQSLKSIFPLAIAPQTSTEEGTVQQTSQVYINTATPELGEELWTSDGTAEGTRLVKDIYPGSLDASPSLMTNLGDRFFLLANDEDGFGLWESRGNSESTRLIKRLSPLPTFLPRQEPPDDTYQLTFTKHQNQIFFSLPVRQPTQNAADEYGEIVYELWVTDGTESGTQQLATTPVHSEDFTAFKDRLFFVGGNRELWVTDGTPEGTREVIDLTPGFRDIPLPCPAPPPDVNVGEDYCIEKVSVSSVPRSLTAHGDYLYFIVSDGDIFRTDGTGQGMQHVYRFDGWPYRDFPPNIVKLGDQLLVMGYEGDLPISLKLWALPE